MSHFENKTEGLARATSLLESTQAGLSQSELAERLGCSVATAKRYIRHLREEGFLEQTSPGKWKLPRQHNMRSLRLRQPEALMVYVALRRLIRQTNKAVDPMMSAIDKVIPILRRDDLVDNLREAADALREKRQATDADNLIWQRLIRGWLEHDLLEIEYLGAGKTTPSVHVCEPYLFEPQYNGDGIYCIVWSQERNGEPLGELRPLKIERIQRVKVLPHKYEPRGNLSVNDLLENAWGIHFGNVQYRVVLRFAPEKARRVQESVYMDDEVKTPQSDGSLLWEVEIAALRELTHWIMGWGAGVEVLEPPELRQQLAAELKAASAQY